MNVDLFIRNLESFEGCVMFESYVSGVIVKISVDCIVKVQNMVCYFFIIWCWIVLFRFYMFQVFYVVWQFVKYGFIVYVNEMFVFKEKKVFRLFVVYYGGQDVIFLGRFIFFYVENLVVDVCIFFICDLWFVNFKLLSFVYIFGDSFIDEKWVFVFKVGEDIVWIFILDDIKMQLLGVMLVSVWFLEVLGCIKIYVVIYGLEQIMYLIVY